MKNILISGGTGLVGTHLTKALLKEGFNVAYLSRHKSNSHSIPTYLWDVKMGKIDTKAFDNVDIIIHLAGAGIADKRWSKQRKHEIVESRSGAAELIFQNIQNLERKPEAFISASAVGYYGMHISQKIFNENDGPSNDFLGETCRQWEESANKFSKLNMRVETIRTGIVLSKSGGALEKMALPVKFCVGAALGNGKQYMPWIHIDDLVGIYMMAIKSNLFGPFNAVAPNHVKNGEMIQLIAKILKKPLFLPNIPSFILKLIFGELAEAILTGSRVSSELIQNSGYKFKYNDIESALVDCFKEN